MQTTAGCSTREIDPGSGLVFYMSDGGMHGLEAALVNQAAGDFEDCFLPSKQELDLMCKELHLGGFGGFTDAFYWRSTEVNNKLA